MKKFIKKLSKLVLSAGLLFSAVTPAFAQEKEFDGEKVSVGLVSGPAIDVWEVIQEKAEKEEGIEIELEIFTDYNQPNTALQNGSIDLNAFQHVAFLEDWNEANDGTLTPLGLTFVSPMGAYSKNIESLDDLKEGDKIAIPNDPTNGGRALLALELAGVIKVDPDKGVFVTPNDIIENPLNIQIEELDAANLYPALEDVAAAFINLNFATDAGLTLDDAIFVDADHPEKLNEKYKNVIAAREEDKDNPLYQKVVELYQSQEGAQALYDTTNGGDKPIWENAPEITEKSN